MQLQICSSMLLEEKIMDKKLAGGAAGLVAAIMYGGSLVLDQESRIAALEAIHPELSAEEPEAEEAAEPPAEPEPEAEEPPEAAEEPEAEELEEE
jgi:hypothetical protein